MLTENARFAVIDVVAGDERYEIMAQKSPARLGRVPDRSTE